MENPMKIWIDGASRGNPGESGAGVVIEESDGCVVDEISEYLGDNLTNNQSEYFALINALEFCVNQGFNEVRIFSDSELLVKQMNGEYDVNSENILNLYEKARSLESKFSEIEYNHVPRNENEAADSLANKAIEEG